jgi:hypothetical protein
MSGVGLYWGRYLFIGWILEERFCEKNKKKLRSSQNANGGGGLDQILILCIQWSKISNDCYGTLDDE